MDDPDAVGNERRAGVERRSGIDRRRNRGVDPQVRLKIAIALGLVLSIPAIQTWSDGALPIDTLAIRVAVAMAFAVVAVNGLNALIEMYQPKPPGRRSTDGIQDAVVVEGETPSG